MTVDEPNNDGSFHGLMRSLNLEESQYKPYSTNFQSQTFSQLSDLKDEIESQLGLFFDLLKNKYGADMSTSLLSNDGYPRSDIDVVSVRLIRVKIIRLRNDHKSLLQALEQKLVEQLGRRDDDDANDEPVSQPTTSFVEAYSIPFALVKEVVANSPAHTSGLREGDKIVVFDGDIHVRNHDNLASISRRVMGRIDQQLTVQVVRQAQQSDAQEPKQQHELVLQLTPTNNWDGRGVLGCRIVPL